MRSRRVMVKLSRALVGAAIVLIALVVGLASAGTRTARLASSAQPLHVRSASLSQDGPELVWSVVLDRPFFPSQLARHGRSLCLWIEHTTNAAAAGQLCVSGRSGLEGSPRLLYQPVAGRGAGPARVIDATVTRATAYELTARFPAPSVGLAYRPFRWRVVSTLRAAACGAPPGGSDCYTLFPTQPVLLRLHVPRLISCIARGPAFVDNRPTNRREVALTFDDGPWPDTPQFLSILEREHVPATFFEIGEHVGQYGEGGAVERRMLRDGDMIGDHTWSHVDVSGAGPRAAFQISAAAAAIKRATGGFQPCLFRAPGGGVSPALISEARSMGFTTIQWNVDPRDWATPGTAAIYGNVVANARNGAIILQHDGGGNRSETLAALPREIATLRHEGYQFVTVTQMLGDTLIYK